MNAGELLRGLVERYSPSGEEQAVVEFHVAAMEALGFQAKVDEAGNSAGQRGDGDQEILLLGHIDTFPGKIPVREEDGRLYGRGAVDAKGPLAAFTMAASAVQPPPGWRVTVIGAVGEEADSRGALALLNRPAPAFLIIGEPSSWERVCLGYKGTVGLQACIESEEFHSSASPVSQAPCDALFAWWAAVLEQCRMVNEGKPRNFDQISPTLRSLASDSDGLRGRASLQASFRLPLEFDLAAFQTALTSFMPPGMHLTWGQGIPAYRAEKNTPLVRAMLAGIRGAGGQPGFSLKSGTADMNLTAPIWGCPTVAYGPGDSSLDHTPQEHIVLAEYLTSIAVLQATLLSLFQAG